MRTDKELFYTYLAQTSPKPLSLEINKADGIYLYDKYGKAYIDFISGISVSNIGHRHPKVIEVIKKQLDDYMHLMVYGEYIESPQVQLAHKLCSFLPEQLNRVYFVNSGAEAVEGAIKLAKKYTGRHQIIAFKNAYHGSTAGALSLMGNEKLKIPFRPLLPGIQFIEFNNFNDLKKINGQTACVISEMIQGEAGIVMPSEGYIEELAHCCKKNGALLIADEIQTGMGRTGKMFAFENYNIIPDILLLAKALGGGMPLGAFISSSTIMKTLINPPLSHITTFGGHPVCCAAALATLNVLDEENIIDNVFLKEQIVKECLSYKKFKVQGKGLFLALNLGTTDFNMKVIEKCLFRGLITDWFLFADHSLRIAPPLNITDSDLKFSCSIIKRSIEELS